MTADVYVLAAQLLLAATPVVPKPTTTALLPASARTATINPGTVPGTVDYLAERVYPIGSGDYVDSAQVFQLDTIVANSGKLAVTGPLTPPTYIGAPR